MMRESMTQSAAEIEVSGVTVSHLADGMLVQLRGSITVEQLPDLRRALLTPLPDGCRDVVVDAGGVEDVDAAGLAVLLAARTWAEEHSARFLLSRTSRCFDAVLADHGVAAELPRLTPTPTAPRRAAVARQREAALV